MKFSIVITTYNRLELLQRAVESALNQSFPCEVVIADDSSCDGTEEYARSLGNRVSYHRNSVNLGHSATVNAGVSAATGEWIKLIDDDDYLAPNCIEEMSAAIATRPNAVICSCQAIQVDADGLEINRTQPISPEKVFGIAQEDIHYGMLLEVLPFGTPVQVAFERGAFLKSGGWDSAFAGNCDDIESWIRIAQYGDAVFVNQYLAYRTMWRGNCSEKLSLQTRLETNILIKQKIYQLVHEKYHLSIPKIEDICAFLRLHWGLVGLKHGKPLTALKISYSSILSLTAWVYLAKVLFARRIQSQSKAIYQNIVPEALLSLELESNTAYPVVKTS